MCGYAVTVHRSQGKTVDQVIVSADAMKQELFYVAASRGREGISIVTSDVERLGESLGVSMARPSAIELANQITQGKAFHEQDLGQGLKQEIKLPIQTQEIGLEMGLGL